jgi:hypothetical protein
MDNQHPIDTHFCSFKMILCFFLEMNVSTHRHCQNLLDLMFQLGVTAMYQNKQYSYLLF